MPPTPPSPDTLPVATLAYERPGRNRSGLFAMRFVTLATLGLLVGSVQLAGDIWAWLLTLGTWSADASIQTPFLFGLVVRILLDTLLLAGSAGTLGRAAWARRTLLIYAKGEFILAMAVIIFLAVISVSGLHARSPYPMLVPLVIGMRCLIAYVCYRACHSMHADFYYKPSSTDSQPVAEGGPRLTVEPRIPRFVVRGVEMSTGRPMEYESSAVTEFLAHKSALALGLDPRSITVEAILQPAAPEPPPSLP